MPLTVSCGLKRVMFLWRGEGRGKKGLKEGARLKNKSTVYCVTDLLLSSARTGEREECL